MRNIETFGITESKAIDLIFNACRANEVREPKGNVSFLLMANGDHEATLRNAQGMVVAFATVDKFDC
jgi:hypothetical protein